MSNRMTARSKHTPTMEEAIDRLSALLIEENAALEAMDFARAGGLLAPKHAAADALAGVPERRMANVMYQRQCLDQFFIQVQRAGDFTRELHNLNRVSKP